VATINSLEEQLKCIGCNFRFWGKAELRELANVLLPGETINHCINGMYEGGFAMLCATDQRVLLIDKKPMYLTIEDIRFDMIAELDYNHRLLNASTVICTPNKTLRFTAYNHARLRKFYLYVQQRVMDIRQHYLQQMQLNEQAIAVEMAQPQLAQALPQQQPPTVPGPQPANFSTPYLASQTVQQSAPSQPPQSIRHHPIVAPIVSAYTRLPLMSRQRRFLGSSAIRSTNNTSRRVPLWQQQ
jgi:hypothetical protein